MYPTPLARLLASQVGLHPTGAKRSKVKPAPVPGGKKTKTKNVVAQVVPLQPDTDDDRNELIARLEHFQQLALINDLETAKTAYHNFKLTKEQETCLEQIHKATQGWVKSLGIHQMADMIVNPMSGRNSSFPANDLLDRVGVAKVAEAGTNTARAYHVKVTQ